MSQQLKLDISSLQQQQVATPAASAEAPTMASAASTQSTRVEASTSANTHAMAPTQATAQAK